MKKILTNTIIFISGLASLAISLILFYNQGIFCDEYNLSPDAIYTSELYSNLDWLRLGLLSIIVIVSLINIIKGIVDLKRHN